MLVSVHLPKTAGTSFYSSLQEHYGNGLVRDYDDLPINTNVLKRKTHAVTMSFRNIIKPNNISCVHGHFLPLKYRFCKDAQFVTWLRNPIERLASHFFYWQRTYDESKAAPLHKRIMEEKWSLEQFCLSPELKNLYSQFLWGIPINKFNFIGITEYYETEIEHFSLQFLGTKARVFDNKKNPNKGPGNYIEDTELLSKVNKYHSKDIELYKFALKKRQQDRPC